MGPQIKTKKFSQIRNMRFFCVICLYDVSMNLCLFALIHVQLICPLFFFFFVCLFMLCLYLLLCLLSVHVLFIYLSCIYNKCIFFEYVAMQTVSFLASVFLTAAAGYSFMTFLLWECVCVCVKHLRICKHCTQ